MDEIPEVFEVTSLEQMRAFADELRVRIYNLLVQQPMTVTQVGEALGEAASKMHYHVRELERVGLLRLVETREKSGILEKYYRAVARSITIPSSFFLALPPDEAFAAVNQFAQSAVSGFLRAASYVYSQPAAEVERYVVSISGASLWVTPEEAKQFQQDLHDLTERYHVRRNNPGEQEVSVFIFAYSEQLPPPGAAPGVSTPTTETIAAPRRAPTIHRVFSAGVVTYSRAELERFAERGETLDINVLGYCAFADDISPDLIERVIARFRARGGVRASAAVREALKRKEAQG